MNNNCRKKEIPWKKVKKNSPRVTRKEDRNCRKIKKVEQIKEG